MSLQLWGVGGSGHRGCWGEAGQTGEPLPGAKAGGDTWGQIPTCSWHLPSMANRQADGLCASQIHLCGKDKRTPWEARVCLPCGTSPGLRGAVGSQPTRAVPEQRSSCKPWTREAWASVRG